MKRILWRKRPEFKDFVHDIAMHIAAANPLYVSEDEVSEDVLEKEKAILRAQALNEGKPEKIVDKMVEGRIQKYKKEICLLEQPFVKDTDKTIKQMVTDQIARIGENVSIRRFTRYEMGEGIEKKSCDFAAEVMQQAGI